MPTCWTCGAETTGFSFSCAACQGLHELSTLRREVARADGKPDRIAEVQQRGFDALKMGFPGTANTIEWGFTDLAWRLDQQADVLKSLDQLLKTPRQLQAKNHRLMGDDLLARGVFEDAEKCYRKSVELSPLDYRGYVGLAETLLRLNRDVEAVRVLKRSLRHAPKDESGTGPIENWRSYSLRLIGHVYACHHNYQKAVKHLGKAIALSPNYADALYDHSQYTGRLSRAQDCVNSLRRAIANKPFYWKLAQRQGAYQPVEQEVTKLLDEIRNSEMNKASQRLKECQPMLKRLSQTFVSDKAELAGLARSNLPPKESDEYRAALSAWEALSKQLAGYEEEFKTLLKVLHTCQDYVQLVSLAQRTRWLFNDISKTTSSYDDTAKKVRIAVDHGVQAKQARQAARNSLVVVVVVAVGILSLILVVILSRLK
jgi:tetratricopeptide (TPR) repeat protein